MFNKQDLYSLLDLHTVTAYSKDQDLENTEGKSLPVKTIPLPVILSNSCEIAEKYDDYLRMLCKEHPSIMRNLRNEKRFIQERKAILSSLIQKIKLDVKDMQAAARQLDSLYDKEKEFQLQKEKEIFELEALLQASYERKNILLSFISKFSTAKTFLNSLATSNKFLNVTSLVQYYLILEALNEHFIQLEMKRMQEMKIVEDIHSQLKILLKEHQFEWMEREKRYKELIIQQEKVKNSNSRLKQTSNSFLNSQSQEQENWEYIKRWTTGICRKISVYKDYSGHSKDFSKQLDEIYDFVEASKKILKRGNI
ncbi:hypothetical protein TNCT_137261 [Trichonephila clavata]|uniref:DUF4200 domain-containing protein n=1 Tax=Trichonephila clavata TaxID=2740835 RepID=A0A8X6FHZ4_TRICU|nr:hypothetical protein TNCT_137261 [Trichonephila clavata]